MGFEDKMSVEDLMKKPQKELMVEIYIQTVKTNGAVTRHNKDIETLKTGQNKIKDMRLAQYYDKLSLITRGRLFDTKRIKEIWNINSGKYSNIIH